MFRYKIRIRKILSVSPAPSQEALAGRWPFANVSLVEDRWRKNPRIVWPLRMR